MNLLTNKHFIQTVGFAGTASLVAAFVVSALEPEPEPIASAPPPPNVHELTTLLDECRRTWHPEARVRLVERHAHRVASLESPLVWILGHDDHPNLDEAIWLAGELGPESVVAPLLALTQRGLPARRALAVHAVEAARRCNDYELEEWLGRDVPETQRAALEVLATRIASGDPVTDPSVCDLVIGLLEHADADVRAAARAAVPPQLPEECRQRLEGRAQLASGAGATEVLGALGQLDGAGLGTAILADRIEDPDPTIAIAALASLRALGPRMDQAEAVGGVALDRARPYEVRRDALRCLEATGKAAQAGLGDLVETPEAPLVLELARCLLTAGDVRGVALLADLVEQGPEALAPLSADRCSKTVAQARRLLCHVTGLSPNATVAEFRRWLEEHPELAPLHSLPRG